MTAHRRSPGSSSLSPLARRWRSASRSAPASRGRPSAGSHRSRSSPAFVASCVGVLIALLRRSPDDRESSRSAGTGSRPAASTSTSRSWSTRCRCVMLLVITGVGFLIHAYSVGYMHGDGEERRFFAYLNLFVFSMLLLVLAGNFLILLVGWGLVGLSSYLLIALLVAAAVGGRRRQEGVHHERDRRRRDRARAVRDLRPRRTRSSYPDGLRQRPRRRSRQGSHTANWVALLLLVGAVAKSAQLPLQTWLPGRDGGPDPGLGPDPRGHDGDRRRVPGRAHVAALRAGAGGAPTWSPSSAPRRSRWPG